MEHDTRGLKQRGLGSDESHDGVFGGGVDRVGRKGNDARHRGGGDKAASAAGLDESRTGSSSQNDAVDIGSHDAAVACQRHGGEIKGFDQVARLGFVGRDTRIQVHDMERPIAAFDFTDPSLPGVGVRDVEGHEFSADFFADGLSSCLIEIGDDDPCAFMGEASGCGLADSRASPCDESNGILESLIESVHVLLLYPTKRGQSLTINDTLFAEGGLGHGGRHLQGRGVMRHRSERPLVIAHRGASAYRPENTLPAYALAVEQGADMIEIDLHLTNDSRIVIAHDSDLDHFGASGSIAESSLAEMKALDAGHKKGVAAEVPTLEEVLDAYGHRIAFNLEFKWAAHGDYLGLESRTLKALNSRGLLDSTLFSSFRESVLRELKRLSPDSRIALLIDPLDSEENRNRMVERAVALGAEAVNPHHFFVNPAMVEAAHQHDLAVYTYTVDDEEEMRRVVEAGVDGIFTNRPDRMRAIWPAT